jgi:hypothetical protein
MGYAKETVESQATAHGMTVIASDSLERRRLACALEGRCVQKPYHRFLSRRKLIDEPIADTDFFKDCLPSNN